MNFLLFFSVVILIYGLANYYIFIRGYQALESYAACRKWYVGMFIVLALSFFAGRIAERYFLSVFSDVMTWVGSFWLAAMLYFLLAVVVTDFLRLIFWMLPISLPFSPAAYLKFKAGYLLVILLTVAVLLVIGYYRAVNPVVTRLDVKIPGKNPVDRQVTVVMVSDIHLGTLIGNSRLERLVKEIESLKPDIILLVGDIVDEDLAPVIRQNLGESLKKLKAPLGVWGITGNHEYIGGAEPAVKYLENHGIAFLRDTAVNIDNAFWLAGREDRDKTRFTGRDRKELKEVLAMTDDSKPVILLDHQPFHLEKTAESKVALQLSGHTHNGQFWPLNLITRAMYDVSHGYLKKGNTHFYVSSGFGTWGPPVRLGTISEIVLVNLTIHQ